MTTKALEQNGVRYFNLDGVNRPFGGCCRRQGTPCARCGQDTRHMTGGYNGPIIACERCDVDESKLWKGPGELPGVDP